MLDLADGLIRSLPAASSAGFSNFLHPVSDAILMGLGQTDTGLAKIELFDVSEITLPVSLGALALMIPWPIATPYRMGSQSFPYWRRQADQHRMAVPVEGYLGDGSWFNKTLSV